MFCFVIFCSTEKLYMTAIIAAVAVVAVVIGVVAVAYKKKKGERLK